MTERMGGMDSIRDLLDGAGSQDVGYGSFALSGAMRWRPKETEGGRPWLSR